MTVSELWPGDPARQDRWKQLLDWLAPALGESVLDVGGGSGSAVAYIADRVGPRGRSVGLERLPAYLTKLKANYSTIGSATPSGVRGEAQALPFADASFDAVLCVNVLEAIVDRPLALAEMRRVLKPGGRVLVAHDDYESMVYAGADRELTRRAVSAYANSKFASYAASDGQMGRQLWGLFSPTGFADPVVRVLPLINTRYREPLVGWTHAQFGAEFVAAASDVTQSEIDRWHVELSAASDRGDYLFCLNLYACLGRKAW
jgi:SAM-dependent methyltransferase